MSAHGFAAALLLCFLLNVSAYADDRQTTKKNRPKEEQSSYTLEAVTVTTRKEREDPQDIPASVSVFSGIEIEDSRSADIVELLNYTPNVQTQWNYSTSRIYFRGIFIPDSALFSSSAFYIDEIPYFIPEMRNPDLYGVESVEVLKGPQGTLFGGNSETGLINITTKAPSNELISEASIGYGSNHTKTIKANVSGPIVEDLLYAGIAVSGRKTAGYMENVHDGDNGKETENRTIRGRVRLTPFDNLKFDLSVTSFDENGQDGSVRLDSGPYKTEPHKINWDGPNRSDRWGNNLGLRVDYEADNYKLTSVTTQFYFKSVYNSDSDLSPLSLREYFFSKQLSGYSQEFRIASPEKQKDWKWLMGVYGFTMETNTHNSFNTIAPMANVDNRFTKIETYNTALFGQTTYTFWDRLHLTGGLRIDHYTHDGEQEYESVGAFPASHSFDDSMENTEFLPKVSLSHDLTDNIMIYGTIAKGYLMGGYNPAFGDTVERFSYDPERMWAYETGFKSTLLDGKMMFNTALFWQEITDKQVMQSVGMSYWLDNSDAVRSRGIEMDVKYRPAKGWNIFAGLGYLDTRVTDWVDPGGVDYKGNWLPYVPMWSYSAGVQYRHETGFTGRLDMYGQSDMYTEPKNSFKEDGYQVFNARIGYESDFWDVNVWCKNLFDKEFIVDRQEWPGGDIGVTDGAPRQFGIDVNVRF